MAERLEHEFIFRFFPQTSVEDCAFNLLQRINIKNLPDLVNKFLFVIFTEKGKKLQGVLTRSVASIKFNCLNVH